ncbi:cupin [Leucobacter weissii]|uniref:Cupin n=1 Tax=Leucobacter weissii TaxID=1983706 RepID=A0A939MNE6_9MICO|nr:cupin [Leucobacter weissii]MBO1901777.1 cupin [Leucobacter weissii]
MGAAAIGELQLENEHFRVTRWTIPPGGAIPLHRHDRAYVVVPLVSDTMLVIDSDGRESVARLTEGESYARSGGFAHEVRNPHSDRPIVFVEVERLS